MFGGAVVTVAGAIQTWLVVDAFDERLVVSGVAAFTRVHPVFNGVVTALLAAVAVLLGLRATPRRLAGVAVAGLLVAGVAGVYLVDPAVAYGDRLAATLTTVEVGVPVTVAGGVLTAVGGVTGVLVGRPRETARERRAPHD